MVCTRIVLNLTKTTLNLCHLAVFIQKSVCPRSLCGLWFVRPGFFSFFFFFKLSITCIASLDKCYTSAFNYLIFFFYKLWLDFFMEITIVLKHFKRGQIPWVSLSMTTTSLKPRVNLSSANAFWCEQLSMPFRLPNISAHNRPWHQNNVSVYISNHSYDTP